MAYASVNDLSELKEASEDYLRYSKKKDKIKAKYSEDCFPSWVPDGRKFITHQGTKEQRQKYQEYLKEVCDLIFEPNGDYQKFVWDFLTPQYEKTQQEFRARGKQGRMLEY